MKKINFAFAAAFLAMAMCFTGCQQTTEDTDMSEVTGKYAITTGTASGFGVEYIRVTINGASSVAYYYIIGGSFDALNALSGNSAASSGATFYETGIATRSGETITFTPSTILSGTGHVAYTQWTGTYSGSTITVTVNKVTASATKTTSSAD